jgi:perosamine synthetase
MINLFHINNYTISTSKYKNILHDPIVQSFEQAIAKYVGAKYAVSLNSATNAIFLILLNKKTTVTVPSVIPPVVLNAIITSGNKYNFKDDIEWVGDSYILHKFKDYKVIDSAQKIEKNQFKKECNPNDLMLFSFYPTKPISGCDGGIIVSDDKEKINYFRELSFNGMSYANNNWERQIKFPGYKMYMNSIQAEIAYKNFIKYEDKKQKLQIIRKKYNKHLGYKNTSNHLYRINIPNNRDCFIKTLKEKGVICGIHYNALHLNSVYNQNKKWNLPLSEKNSNKTVSIPFHEKLTDTQVQYIIDLIKNGNFHS